MNDRELLELAAEAAGKSGKYVELHGGGMKFYGIETSIGEALWNPLEDDGDAFRLAVRLGIFFRTDFLKTLGDLLNDGLEPYEATRRAITTIASEIARQSKEGKDNAG